DPADAGRVADEAVGHEGRDAAILQHAHDEIADDRGLGEGIGAAYDDVTRLRLVERVEDGKTVRRPRLAGERHPAEARLRRDRLDAMAERAAAAHRIDDVAGERSGKGLDLLRRGPRKAAAHGEKGRIVDHRFLTSLRPGP